MLRRARCGAPAGARSLGRWSAGGGAAWWCPDGSESESDTDTAEAVWPGRDSPKTIPAAQAASERVRVMQREATGSESGAPGPGPARRTPSRRPAPSPVPSDARATACQTPGLGGPAVPVMPVSPLKLGLRTSPSSGDDGRAGRGGAGIRLGVPGGRLSANGSKPQADSERRRTGQPGAKCKGSLPVKS
jgi:hypothetical protein